MRWGLYAVDTFYFHTTSKQCLGIYFWLKDNTCRGRCCFACWDIPKPFSKISGAIFLKPRCVCFFEGGMEGLSFGLVAGFGFGVFGLWVAEEVIDIGFCGEKLFHFFIRFSVFSVEFVF